MTSPEGPTDKALFGFILRQDGPGPFSSALKLFAHQTKDIGNWHPSQEGLTPTKLLHSYLTLVEFYEYFLSPKLAWPAPQSAVRNELRSNDNITARRSARR